jgi:hypothetical protein
MLTNACKGTVLNPAFRGLWGYSVSTAVDILRTLGEPMRHRSGSVRQINASALTIEKTTKPRTKTPKEELTFGTTLSDHMLCVEWDEKNKWSNPKIIPYQDLKLSPAASVLHYGKLRDTPAYLLTCCCWGEKLCCSLYI